MNLFTFSLEFIAEISLERKLIHRMIRLESIERGAEERNGERMKKLISIVEYRIPRGKKLQVFCLDNV